MDRSPKAFLFGVVAHSLSDLSWHSLQGLQEGFIRAQAATSFSGDYAKAHTLADEGGDYVLRHMRDLNHLQVDWIVPVKDMMEVYRIRNFTVVESEFVQCLAKGYAGSQAKARLTPPFFEKNANQASTPFLMEQMEEYPMGGFYDMTDWTLQCWNGLSKYLNKDPSTNLTSPQEPFNLCDELMDEKTRKSTTPLSTKRKGKNSRRNSDQELIYRRHNHISRRSPVEQPGIEDLEKAGLTVRTEIDDRTGMVTFSIQKLNQPIPTNSFDPPPAINKRDVIRCSDIKGSKTASLSKTLFLPSAYASLGHASVIGDFDGDGSSELVLSAPHFILDVLVPSQGSVYIIPSKSLLASPPSSDIRLLASRVLHGDPKEPQSRFGFSLAVVDLNRDGIDDLAIGAPGTGAKDINYDGAVYVYFGKRGRGLSQEPNLRIGYDRSAHIIPDAYNIMAGVGYTLFGADLTGSGYQDLIIGMPMATTINATADPTADPSLKYKLQAGRVIAFLSSSLHIGDKLDTDADWSLEGDSAYEWFGSSFSIVSVSPTLEKVVAIGSPKFGEIAGSMAGKVQGFSLSSLSKLSETGPRKVFKIFGTSKFQQFGSRLSSFHSYKSSSEDFKTHLVVGSRSESLSDGTWQAGVLRILDFSKIVPGTVSNLSNISSSTIFGTPLHGSQSVSQLSTAFSILNNNSSAGHSIWVSEPYVNSEDGRVIKWEVNNQTSAITNCYQVEAGSKSRFGTRILSIDLDKDGKEDLVITSLHDSRYAE
ncbi:Glycosylphosphatidylinositol specific phospholipase D1 [Entomortierella beljakovae]|nr:Glycosylphosphatidylinositol specific phospholipase D1 [Entomortierella beljakovae]